MHELKKAGERSFDPVPDVIEKVLADSYLLCFDEFQVKLLFYVVERDSLMARKPLRGIQ